jgi:hypothetical protein
MLVSIEQALSRPPDPPRSMMPTAQATTVLRALASRFVARNTAADLAQIFTDRDVAI